MTSTTDGDKPVSVNQPRPANKTGGQGQEIVVPLREGESRLVPYVIARPPAPFTAKSLMAEELPEPRWVVPGLITEGLTILAGPPKVGKSWLVLQIALTVASAGKVLGSIQASKTGVLYLALEDRKRRLQERLNILLRNENGTVDSPPDGLLFEVDWPKLDQHGFEYLDKYLSDHPETGLVIIDTFERVHVKRKSNANIYAEDYAAVQMLKTLADWHRVAIVIIHHLRKGEADDPIEMVSGSTGLTAAADTILVLRRERGQADAFLYTTGRDIDEQELGLQWDKQTCLWTLLGEANEFRLSPARAEIRRVLVDSKKALTPKQMAIVLSKEHNNVKQLMWNMEKDGQIQSDELGGYMVDNNGNHDDLDNPNNHDNRN